MKSRKAMEDRRGNTMLEMRSEKCRGFDDQTTGSRLPTVSRQSCRQLRPCSSSSSGRSGRDVENECVLQVRPPLVRNQLAYANVRRGKSPAEGRRGGSVIRFSSFANWTCQCLGLQMERCSRVHRVPKTLFSSRYASVSFRGIQQQ